MKRKNIVKITRIVTTRVLGTLAYATTTVVYAIGGKKAVDKSYDWVIEQFKKLESK